ncbi:MAG: UDP-N-acetylglucosamine 2-epimerase [Hydrogenovibrio sp.]|uniref:UDP-N-acetylglucosamine 2-epimerase n=1 Tax=Hydrogenovibrio sp. TaxID=2065821 RepID=UPI002870A472|nr:UDP-N-acetylglucosamine 2-epimerase [Hydrogenovibrio sp.]MDR9499365.1 UDP-N-acetylglucosamine 2-epimerase [Hydrogenovibrio sp.]
MTAQTSPCPIAVVTATRAEFGLMRRLITQLQAHPDFDCKLWVTGAHLSPEQGMTVHEIEKAGLTIDARVPIIQPDQGSSALDTTQIAARALETFGALFSRHRPKAVLLLGDRYEMLAIGAAALFSQVPIVHLHGGEVTEGAMDEAIRHALTKLASLHFVAAEPYRRRVIQMGESPERVWNVGAPGLDVIRHTDYLSRDALVETLNWSWRAPLLLVTFHPVTWHQQGESEGVPPLFEALERIPDAHVLWTSANTDVGGKQLNQLVDDWAEKTPINVKRVTSLGSQRYLSLMRLADAVVGNSSSGIIEAPALGVPTVNIGARQDGRLRADSIIDCQAEAELIENAINTAISAEFQAKAQACQSVYGEGQTAEQITEIMSDCLIDRPEALGRKRFYDLP